MIYRSVAFTLVLALLVSDLTVLECRRSGGTGRRTSSRVATTSRPNRRTTSYSRQQTTQRSAQKATTPRYNVQTQQAYPSHNQPSYNQPGYNQPGYNQPHYNQPGYNQPHYNQPGYNQPHYNQPGYNQPHFNQPGYNQPFPSSGVWQQKQNNHGVRNAVLAGLGGSALGLYLGYKIGGLTSGDHGNSYVGGGASGQPQYSVVHHYHHGDRPIPKEAKVEADGIKQCGNITFCTPNTNALCMSNGTVYCVASLDSTIKCTENSTEFQCVNSTITFPCDNSTTCNGTSMNTTSISIPCVTTIDVFGDFNTNKLSVNKISKREVEAEVTTVASTETTNSSSTTVASNVTDAPSLTTIPTAAALTNNNPSSSLTSQGISNKYCVTVIAEPVKEPEAPVEKPHMTNEEYARFVSTNEVAQKESSEKLSEVLNVIAEFVMF